MIAPTSADFGRRVVYHSPLPREDWRGVLVGLTGVEEFVLVRFEGDVRDEATAADLLEFLDEQKERA